MKFKKLSLITFGCLGIAMAAEANDVLLTANEPTKITFRVAHKSQNSPPQLGELQSLNVHKPIVIPVSLDNYDKAGIVIVSVNEHELPPSINQFDQPGQCSMTTDKTKSKGEIAFTVSSNKLTCHTRGGVFG